MSTTTLCELEVVFSSINKFREFTLLSEGSAADQELIKQYVNLNSSGYAETIKKAEEKVYYIPEAFRKEIEQCQQRCQKYIETQFKDVYYFIDGKKMIKTMEGKMEQRDVIYVMSLEEIYNDQPPGMLQANRVEGYTTRPVSEALPGMELSQFNTTFVFGTGAGAAGAVAGQEWGATTTTLSRAMNNVSEIYLNEIQFKTVTGVTSGDGYCRLRLKVQEKEILEDNCTTNFKSGVNSGFTVLLDSATGLIQFDPPRLIKHFKNRDGTFNANSAVQLSVLDENGSPRGYQKITLNMNFVTKYYQ